MAARETHASGSGGSVLAAVTGYLGLTPQQLRADLAAGKTLAQIATAEGKSVGGLEQAIESAVTARLDQAVAAGKITAAQEQAILAKLQTRLDTLVNTPHPGRGLVRGGVRRALIRIAAGYLGLTPQQLRSDLQSGQSLAQIAAAQGKNVAGLEQTLIAAVKARLDQAVAAGKITAAQEQAILSRLTARLNALVTHP